MAPKARTDDSQMRGVFRRLDGGSRRQRSDRTFAGVMLLDTATHSTGPPQMAYIHLIFDPGRKSHLSAEANHGYSDWALRHQESFGIYAATIERFFDSADLVVAHNAE